MRLLVTADLHYNHARAHGRWRTTLIDDMNRAGGDVLLVVGDTAVADGDALEQCLSPFSFAGPKLFVAGNHELWTHGDDSYAIFTEELPRRVPRARVALAGRRAVRRAATSPSSAASAGTTTPSPRRAWIPQRFYEHKVSPGAAEQLEQSPHLLDDADDISAARDGGRRALERRPIREAAPQRRSDFLDELTRRSSISSSPSLAHVKHVVAAIHHLPFRELLPPPRTAQWDFAKAYLGSDAVGDAAEASATSATPSAATATSPPRRRSATSTPSTSAAATAARRSRRSTSDRVAIDRRAVRRQMSPPRGWSLPPRPSRLAAFCIARRPLTRPTLAPHAGQSLIARLLLQARPGAGRRNFGHREDISES